MDGYQGREADVVVFSAVRCNEDGNLGFLADPRRLNVAITRPRRWDLLAFVTSYLLIQSDVFHWACPALPSKSRPTGPCRRCQLCCAARTQGRTPHK